MEREGERETRTASCLRKNQLTELVCLLIPFRIGPVLVCGNLNLGLRRDLVRDTQLPTCPGPRARQQEDELMVLGTSVGLFRP